MSIYQKFRENSPTQDLTAPLYINEHFDYNTVVNNCAGKFNQQQQQHIDYNLNSLTPTKKQIVNCTSVAKQQAQAQIQKVMNQIKTGAGSILKQQTSCLSGTTFNLTTNNHNSGHQCSKQHHHYNHNSYNNHHQATNQHNNIMYRRLSELSTNTDLNYYHDNSNIYNINVQQQQQHPQLNNSQQQYPVKVEVKQQQQQAKRGDRKQEKTSNTLEHVKDPALLRWLQDIRFEPELEPLAFQARTCAHDEYSATALSIRYSQVSIQQIRTISTEILDFIDHLIDLLPLNLNCIGKYFVEFSDLYKRLVEQTSDKTFISDKQQVITKTTTFLNPSGGVSNNNNPLTITYTTPKKASTVLKAIRPLDSVIIQIRNICLDHSNLLYSYQDRAASCSASASASVSGASCSRREEAAHFTQNSRFIINSTPRRLNGHDSVVNNNNHLIVDNGLLESDLRKLKELYGKFVEISIKAECSNIIEALTFNFDNNIESHKLLFERLSSSSSLASSASVCKPVKPFESSNCQLPLKWALIALWQLTKDDSYICGILTEKWQRISFDEQNNQQQNLCRPLTNMGHDVTNCNHSNTRSTTPKTNRLDYSTKYDNISNNCSTQQQDNNVKGNFKSTLSHSDYQKLFDLCQKEHPESFMTCKQQQQPSGALKSALKSKEETLKGFKEASTIELLINVIIKQPNKHERLDMLNYIHAAVEKQDNELTNNENTINTNTNNLINLDEWNQSVSAAIYTSNQYKIAALRILNHLCINEQAIKTILKCFSTPPPAPGYPVPENKIIRSIFECYQTSQEHIYQNETMLKRINKTKVRVSNCSAQNNNRARKRSRQDYNNININNNNNNNNCSPDHLVQDNYSDYSDYGSRGHEGSASYGTTTNTTTTTTTTKTTGRRQAATQSGKENNNAYNVAKDDVVVDDDEEDEDDGDGDDGVVLEAISLIVQLTNSFHNSNQGLDFYTLIGRFSIDSLVKYFSNIIKTTKNRELLLLSLTALANISFITTEPMRFYGTNQIMLEMFRSNKLRSKDLQLRDQAVTILANTADKDAFDIVSNGGLSFLMSCLESCPTRMATYGDSNQDLRQQQEHLDSCENDYGSIYACSTTASYRNTRIIDNKPRDRKPIDFGGDFPDILNCTCDDDNDLDDVDYIRRKHSNYKTMSMVNLCLSRLSQADLAAMERIHQKTAVAFARMSIDTTTTKLILKYGGIKKMIGLCKFNYKRNFSDTVLIACIAALRKMAKVIGKETFRYYNALDLIELELNKALEIYGCNEMKNDYLGFQFASEV